MFEPVVRRSVSADRFEIFVGGALAGFADFRDGAGSRNFYHTEVFPEFQGRGLSKPLIAAAVEATRKESLAVVADCSAVRRWLEREGSSQEGQV